MFSSSSSRKSWRSDEDRASTIRQAPPAVDLSDSEPGEDEDDDEEFEYPGADYSARMEELLSEPEDEEDEDEDDPDSEFVYTGVDAEVSSANYRDQLRDVLGPEHEDTDQESHDGHEGPRLSSHENRSGETLDDATRSEGTSDSMPSSSMEGSFLITSSMTGLPLGFSRDLSKSPTPHLHPTVSRLRSNIPPFQGQSRVASPASNSNTTFHSRSLGVSPSPSSHFSAISSASSIDTRTAQSSTAADAHIEREVFRWAQLGTITRAVCAPANAPHKASAVLGSVLGGTSPEMRSPTVLAANGLICIGTAAGRVYVFDFKQTARCICGGDNSEKTVGPVTAIALSHDHTYLATGHLTGHIQLFDLKDPSRPARHVTPLTLSAVHSGRHEGHLQGSRIVGVGFIGGRHTAIVSADEKGLAFYHSLGKVLFVEASDILRILGKYPEPDETDLHTPVARTPTNSLPPPLAANGTPPAIRRKTRYTILGMMPLPLGTTPHPTDAYNVIALLTPAKLVVVGLKPTSRTWFKHPRELDADESRASKTRSRLRGTLAWFPSVIPKGLPQDEKTPPKPTTPALAFSWGNTMYLIRVSESKIRQSVRNLRSGKVSELEVGTIVFEHVVKWKASEGEGEDILALQWLNANQVLVLMTSTLQVYDVQASKAVERVSFDPSVLISPTSEPETMDSQLNVAHSMQVYKGKIFLLGRHEIQVGTLLTWADRILSFVAEGDFLNAIDLAQSYYIGEAPGNTNGLPDDMHLRRDLVGIRMRDLMIASTKYTFSEDRMTDGTHVTPDGRGVDRTSLFEGLVTTCARACIVLDYLDFLFEDLYQNYEDNGISRIFLTQLEPFVLNSQIREVPPRITQRLVAMHDEDGRPDLVEQVIWHIDPANLDISQTIQLCQEHQLYDALIYIYTRAMRDYLSPVVELLALIRRIHQYRKFRASAADAASQAAEDAAIEPVAINAYKIYSYLANILSGLSYPSEEPLSEDEAFQAKKEIYSFLFLGRSSVWPVGDGGKLVLTADEDGGVEPTFPYARTLLRFDPESFLHSLDIAFEDGYLNDERQGVSRLVIVKTLLDIVTSPVPPPATLTFVNIFIARNVPKYPQFIQISPSVLHNILISLAEDADQTTREDRQLAAEYLLSVYTPHEGERIIRLFEAAGFYRILRSWHRQDRRWTSLMLTYLRDPDLPASQMFHCVDDVLDTSTRLNKGSLPHELLLSMEDALSQLLLASVTGTASLLDKHIPSLHQKALDALGRDAGHMHFSYLRHLLGPPKSDYGDGDEYLTPLRHPPRQIHPPTALCQLFIALQCQYEPAEVIEAIKHLPPESLDWNQMLQTCEDKEVYNAVVWALNWRGEPRIALSKAETFEKRVTLKIVELFDSPVTPQSLSDIEREVTVLEGVGRTAIAVCLEHSQGDSAVDVPLEDIWFQLLRSQITCVQIVSAYAPHETDPSDPDDIPAVRHRTLSALRALVQDSFASLVSISSTRAVSFARLFKRLVDSTTQSQSSSGTPYTEFRTILTGMLESYRSQEDMLNITKHLVDRDLFETIAEGVRERAQGWASLSGRCSVCRKALIDISTPELKPAETIARARIVVSRTGDIYHQFCSPADL